MNLKGGQVMLTANPGMIAQNDDPGILEWLSNADFSGGGFISSFARAALVADWENYGLLRPVILVLRAKYPAYEASEQVKAEIRERKAES
jgi:hypothetical protein